MPGPSAHRARAALGKYLAAASSAVSNKLAYRADLVGQALSYSIFILVFVNLWTAVFLKKPSISGYTRESAIWYFIVAEIAAFANSGAFWSISEEVKSGSVAYSLGRPYGYVAYQYAQHLGGIVLTQAMLLVLGAVYGIVSAGPLPISGFLHVPAVLASLFLGASLNFFLLACISLAAFWFEENSAFFWIYQKLILVVGTLMPVEFLPEALRPWVRLSPFSSVTYAPARIAVSYSPASALATLGLQAAWALVFASIAALIYRKGAKHVSVQGG